MNRQPLRAREALDRWADRQKCWKPDFRAGEGLGRMLVAICIAVPVAVLVLFRFGGPS